MIIDNKAYTKASAASGHVLIHTDGEVGVYLTPEESRQLRVSLLKAEQAIAGPYTPTATDRINVSEFGDVEVSTTPDYELENVFYVSIVPFDMCLQNVVDAGSLVLTVKESRAIRKAMKRHENAIIAAVVSE